MHPEEPVDIVDEDDRVLYQTTKSDAHAQGLLHRTVIAEMINSRGEWILVKQASDRQDPGQYVSPTGGHVQAGESVEEALKREVKEELGIEPSRYRFVGKAIYRRTVRGRDENHYFILYEIFSDEEPILNHESVSWKRFTMEELARELSEKPEQFGAAFHFVIRTFYPKIFIAR